MITSGPILVVDDEVRILRFVQSALTYKGYRVITATNAQEALQAAEAERPELIFVDIRMPGMDGLQLAKEIRNRLGSAVPTVALTAASTTKAALQEAGVSGLLRKPFDLDDIIECIARYAPAAPAQ